jgi:diguanylate cyclase (GGDEF)-like protein
MIWRAHADAGRRAVRGAVWAGLVALLLVRLLALAGRLGAGSDVLRELAYLLPIVLSGAGAAWVALHSSGLERRFWSTLALATALVLVTEGYYSYYVLTVDSAGPAVPGPYQLFALGAATAFFVMVVTMSRFGGASLVARGRFYTGVAAGMVVLYVAFFEYWIVPLYSDVPGVSPATLAGSAVYPVVGVTVFVATFGVILGWKSSRWRPWERLIAAAMVVYSLGVLLMPTWNHAAALGLAATPAVSLDQLGISLGPYLLFMATVYRLTYVGAETSMRTGPVLDEAPMLVTILYPVVLAVLVLLLGTGAIARAGTPDARVFLVTAVLLAFLMILRSSLSWLELAQHRVRAAVDPLTELGNEKALRERLAQDATEAERYRGDVALTVIDVDDFSRVNDLHGHDAGDAVIRAVARVLNGECVDGCTAYRAGGDEFAIVAPGRTSGDTLDLARRITQAIEREVAYKGLGVTASAGVAAFSEAGDVTTLVSQAFSALQSSKLKGPGSVTAYDPRVLSLPSPDERLDLARKQSYLATVRALAAAVDARDSASRDHSRNVGRLSSRLALELGVAPDRATVIETAGLIHDIGKIALPDELLSKRAALSEADRARLREHVELGDRILRSTDLAFVRPWVRAHHERWDGTGYPDGLAGDGIPFEARILSVCDAYDAMTSGLIGTPSMDPCEAIREIEMNAGGQFDPGVAEAFIRMVTRETNEEERDHVR